MLSRFFILIFLTSCSLFKGSEKLSGHDLLKNLQSIKVEGEGKGRLHIHERQYLFGVESLLKENNDWIMGVSIPLHGEELLIFPDLMQEKMDNDEIDSFELRIDAGIKENLKGTSLRGKSFLEALRKTLRFLLASKLKLPVVCRMEEYKQICNLGEDEFIVLFAEKEIRMTYEFAGHQLVTTASNLTGPIFKNTQFRVASPGNKRELLTLELFWQ